MSNDNNTALTVALGAGAGLGLWYLLRDDETADDGGASEAAPAPQSAPCSLRLDANGLTADGAAIDVPTAVAKCQAAGRADLVIGDDAPSTVSAELSAAFGTAGILINQRRNAGAPRRPRRGARRAHFAREGRTILRDGQAVLHLERVDLGDGRFALTPHETDVLAQRVVDLLNRTGARRQAASSQDRAAHQVFLFRTMPKNGNSRTRWYQANPPTTWEDAKRRIVAAGLLDERILLPTEWSLVTDLPSQIRVPADRLRPLP